MSHSHHQPHQRLVDTAGTGIHDDPQEVVQKTQDPKGLESDKKKLSNPRGFANCGSPKKMISIGEVSQVGTDPPKKNGWRSEY